VGDGLLGRDHSKFAEAIPALGFLGLDQASGIKRLSPLLQSDRRGLKHRTG
jgi:hypothetical protein